MSDVLRRLALRALPGLGEAVRPRLASRYESVPGPLHGAETGIAAPVADVDSSGVTAPQRGSGEASAPKARGRAKAPPAAAAAVPSPPFAPPAAATAPHPLPFRADPEPPPEGPGPPARGRIDAAHRREDGPAAPALSPPPPAPGSAAIEPRPAMPLLLPEMRPPPEAGPITGEEMGGRAADLAPDIRISIGRIDIRSAAEPRKNPPRPRARTRPTLMSLEDYLGKGRSRS
ncbi:MAG TPA: hypothetical protein VEA61_12595 [Allosphingosinicella sp.]|nr:hypothetical protein [Allosphingosinicella sp.]